VPVFGNDVTRRTQAVAVKAAGRITSVGQDITGRAIPRLSLAVEKFMKRYYRTIMELSRLNEMLLELFQEAILHADAPRSVTPISRRFQAVNGFIEVTDDKVFKRYPFALLEVFLIVQQHDELKGVRASTIRLIRDHRHLIDGKFRTDIRARSLFMEILKQPNRITRELRRMHRYGVLEEYLPVFGAVVGQMQYDLFHTYTVDEHSLFVVQNIRAFASPGSFSIGLAATGIAG
jgi:[protein-PII] uridylyltransferase